MEVASTSGVSEPCLGLEFESAEEAWAFYNDYACRVGFSTRISVYQRSRRDGSITARQFVCSREGFRAPRGSRDAGGGEERPRRVRAVTRVGCKAMIRVKRRENGRWFVAKLEPVHNHDLVAPSLAHCHRSRRLLSESTKNCRSLAVGNGVCLSQGLLPFDGGSGVEVVDYLKRMQVEEPGFFLAMQVDGDHHHKGNIFWADERSRTAYRCFADVVVVDMSYKMNQSQVSFACFTGVNHHRQPVLFGCALLVDDSNSSLVWLLSTFLAAMMGRCPASVIVEQDSSMQAAVRQVFPEARYRICKWHVLKDAGDKLVHVFRAHESFGEEFHKCINMTETIDEFELSWEILVSRYGLGENAWLRSVYSYRHKWVPVYLRDTFFAEFAPSQKCECRSSLFEGFLSVQTGPQIFIQQYEKALDILYEKEVKADFDTIYTLPVLKTQSPLEKQASELYTSKIFVRFQEELIQTRDYTANKINEESDASTYKVAILEEGHKVYDVIFNALQLKATCCCRMFEYSGILCRHILKVFNIANVLSLPSHYILKRWTRNAKDEAVNDRINDNVVNEVDVKSQNNGQDVHQSHTWRYNSLCHEAIKFAEDGATSLEIYNVAINALQEAVKKVAMAKRNLGKGEVPGALTNGTGTQQASGTEKQGGVRLLPYYNSLNEVTQTIASEHLRQTLPLQGQQSQQPCNFLSVAPSLRSENGSQNLLTTSAPLALNATNGSLDGNKSVLASLPTGSITKIESNHGNTTPLPSQEQKNVSSIDQTSSISDVAGNATIAGSSEAELMAVPMTLCLPVIGNSSIASSDPTQSNLASNPSQQQQQVPHMVTLQRELQTTASDLSTNSLRATAIAVGARIASPTAAISIIKAMQSKNVIHIKAGETSPLGSSAPKPSCAPADTSMAVNATRGCSLSMNGFSNKPSDAQMELTDKATDADQTGEDQAPKERGMNFTDWSDDENMIDGDDQQASRLETQQYQ